MLFQRNFLVFLNKGKDVNVLRNKIVQNSKKSEYAKRIIFAQKHNFSTHRNDLIVRSPYPDVEIPNKTFTELIWERHKKWKNLKAVECAMSGQAYSYAELIEQSENFGRGLRNLGLHSEDVLAIVLPNMPDFLIAILGAAREGLSICSINPSFTPDEITRIIKNIGAKCIITLPEKLEDIVKVTENLTVCSNYKPTKIILTNSIDGRDKDFFMKTSLFSPEIKSFYEIKVSGKKEMNNQCTAVPMNLMDSTVFIAFTSGTTGLPKGVRISNKNLTASITLKSIKQLPLFKETTNTHQEVLLTVLPMFHLFGLDYVITCLWHGSKVVMLPKFEASTYLSSLKKHKATMIVIPPPTLHFLATYSQVTREHLEHLRCVIYGGAPSSEECVEQFLKKTPHTNFFQGYGATETLSTTFTPRGIKNYKSIGVPNANTEIKVIDPKSGSLKEAFQEGEVCIRGPQISCGYFNSTEKLVDNEGWCHTGDMGYYDNEKYFYIVDRLKEMIKVKAFQVAPAELEAVLKSHPGVEDAGVTSKPHKRKGEEPVGFIRAKRGVQLCEEELKIFLQKKVAPFKVISQFIFVDSIPRNPTGKILRIELKNKLKSICDEAKNI